MENFDLFTEPWVLPSTCPPFSSLLRTVGPPDRGSSSDSVVFRVNRGSPLGTCWSFLFSFLFGEPWVLRGLTLFFPLLRTVGPPDRGSSSDLVGFWDEPWVPLGLGGFGGRTVGPPWTWPFSRQTVGPPSTGLFLR